MIMQRKDWRDIARERLGHGAKPRAPVEAVAPRCRQCHKKLAKLSRLKDVPRGQCRTKGEAQALFSERVLSTVRDLDGVFIQSVGVWNGKSYQGYPRRLPHFCTTACAVEFALAAAQAGYRRKG